jgi:uncharacterized membrane protein
MKTAMWFVIAVLSIAYIVTGESPLSWKLIGVIAGIAFIMSFWYYERREKRKADEAFEEYHLNN